MRYAKIDAPIGSPKMVMAIRLVFRCRNAQLMEVWPISWGTMASKTIKTYEDGLKPVNGIPEEIEVINRKSAENEYTMET